MGEWIRLGIGMACLLLGLFFVVTAVIGVFRFRFVLSRMQAAALGDTCGLGFALLGLAVLGGFSLQTLKLFLVILFQWISSPVCSHMLLLMEMNIGERHGAAHEKNKEAAE